MKQVIPPSWRTLIYSRDSFIYIWGPIALITFGHYFVSHHYHWFHDVLRRLYYLPIIFGAFLFGIRGALGASVLTSVLYVPHAFLHFINPDPAQGIEKSLEILLFNTIAVVTGYLVDSEHRKHLQLKLALDDKKQMEEQLIRSGRLQALGQMTAGLAHEIKNPLASLKGAVDIISDEIKPDSPRFRMLDILRKELDRLEKLLNRFLLFAKPQPFTSENLSFGDLISRTLPILEAEAGKRKVNITHSESDEGIFFQGNKEKLIQVLVNLGLNALQSTPENGTVKISCRKNTPTTKSAVRITVEDSGPGIPPDIAESIFNPFFTTRGSGSGLGLSIAARLIDQHNGTISLGKSDLGGACFIISLP